MFTFHVTNNLGDVACAVEYTNDLPTAYTTATNGVAITGAAHGTASNLVTTTLPASLGSPLFTRVRATLDPTSTGSATRISVQTSALSASTSQTKVRSKK